jgi:hypothetical protein
LSALLARVALLLALVSPAWAEPRTAFLWWGEPDPSGADQAFLSLARRRGAQALRETPGQLGTDGASARLQRAVAAYQAMKLDDTLRELDALERELLPTGGGGLGQGELVDLHAYRAAARLARGDEAAAWDDLVAVARLAPGRPLDPARFPPRVIEAARRAADSLPARATLTVSATPDDALLIVDGQLLGRGRVEVSVPPGAHLVRAERSGFRAAGQVVEVPAGGTEVKLAPEPVTPPTTQELARRGALAGAVQLVAAWVEAKDGAAQIVVDRIDPATGLSLRRTSVRDDAQITATALASAVDQLIVGDEPPVTLTRRPWWKSPVLWGVVGGLSAAALGVGLGVGLGVSHENGSTARVDLGAAR